jgi:hypothetical protein
LKVVPCAGAPRDLGLDQGGAWVPELRRLRPGRRGDAAQRPLERDLRRHFPQLAERLEGIARGARVPLRILFAALARELGADAEGDAPVTRAAALWGFAETESRGGATLVWAAPDAGLPWRVRRSRPENGLASLELVVPWLPGAVAGVNAAGLAVACTTLEARVASVSLCSAPAFLLVQECLQRFESIEGAEDWCLHRPAGGTATLVLSHAAGGLVGVLVAGTKRERVVPEGGTLTPSDPRMHRPQIAAKERAASGLERAAEVALLLQDAAGGEFVPSSPAAEPGIRAVALDARERRLWVLRGKEALHVFDLVPNSLDEAASAGREAGKGPAQCVGTPFLDSETSPESDLRT